MDVFVLGGTGAVGRPTVDALVAAGHTVTALARTPVKAAQLESQGATPSGASIFDREQLAEAFADHEAVVNLASSLPSTSGFIRAKAWQDCHRIRTEGSANVVDAALTTGVGRVIQESVAMLYPDGGADWIDEDVPPDRYPIAKGNLAAEASARRFTDAGGTGVVLRFGLFYGKGARHSEEFAALARRHVAMVMGPASNYLSSIHLADAGTAVVAALGVPAGTYNIVDDEPLTKRQNADALAAAVGRATWIRWPGRLATLLGDRTTSLTRSLRVSNARFRAASGWSPRYPSAREGWVATATDLGLSPVSP